MNTNPESVKLLRLLLLIVLPTGLLSQTFELSGTVKNSEGQLVPFANVVLLQVSDSSLVKGSSADDQGRFIITEITPDLYYLQARYFGNRSHTAVKI